MKKFRSTSGEYLRGRIVDPTGAFNVYAGHYQPEALVSLSNLTEMGSKGKESSWF
jgi:RPA family protein